jgi:hypothetical protein
MVCKRAALFRGRHFTDEIIVLCVHWYFSSPVRRAWLSACERHAKAVAAALVSDSHGALSLGAPDIVAMSLLSVFA